MITTANQDRQFGSASFDPHALARIHGAPERTSSLSRQARLVRAAAVFTMATAGVVWVGSGINHWKQSRSAANAPLVLQPGEPVFTVTVQSGQGPEDVAKEFTRIGGHHNLGRLTDFITKQEVDGVLQLGQSVVVPGDIYTYRVANPDEPHN